MTKNKNTLKCELRKHLHSLEARISATTGHVVLGPDDFPMLPSTIRSQAITIRKTFKYINDCYRLDVVHFRAARETYRHLGLAILAVIFCPNLSELCIRIESAESEVRSIKIRYNGTTPRAAFEYLTVPHSFKYYPAEISETPWVGRRIPETGWPEFLLTYSGSEPEEHWEERDTIEGFGSDDAAVLVASLLLDIGRLENHQHLVKLETQVGYGGVSKLSPEVHFHLPESESWPLSK
jgi:hypothetical protein